MDKVGLGLVTYNRPDYFWKSATEILNKLSDVVDEFYFYKDGFNRKTEGEYQEIILDLTVMYPDIFICDADKNRGVGYAKNHCFRELMKSECDYIFMVEDDIIPLDVRAITAYIDLYKETGYEHFNFAHHGKLTAKQQPVSIDGNIAKWHDCVGAWSFYTRNCLEKAGLIDPFFYNAWDHVEHTARIAELGLTTPFWQFADHKDSSQFLQEIPGSADNRAISYGNVVGGKKHWERKSGGIPPEIL